MECSSFIASSAFPDPAIAGKGYLARLSGSTAEFMDIWKLMFLGPSLFSVTEHGHLQMELTPALPSWLFEDKESGSDPKFDDAGNHVVKFKLFASIPVTYHNPGGVDRFGESPKRYVVTMTGGKVIKIDGPTIPSQTAAEIRRMKRVSSIDAYF